MEPEPPFQRNCPPGVASSSNLRNVSTGPLAGARRATRSQTTGCEAKRKADVTTMDWQLQTCFRISVAVLAHLHPETPSFYPRNRPPSLSQKRPAPAPPSHNVVGFCSKRCCRCSRAFWSAALVAAYTGLFVLVSAGYWAACRCWARSPHLPPLLCGQSRVTSW